MTVICAGGGTSSSRPGFGETVVASAAVFANIFLNSPSPWAAAAAGLMAATVYDLTTFCASDPPPLVVPTALEWAQFLGTSTPLVVGPVSAVVSNFFAYYAWFAFCKCDAGAPPVAAPATEPVGTPQVNPPVSPPLISPCKTYATPEVVSSGAAINMGLTQKLPANVDLNVFLDIATVPHGGAHTDAWEITPKWLHGGTIIRTDTTQIVAYPAGTIQTLAPPPTADGFLPDAFPDPSFPTTDGVVATVRMYCGGALPTAIAQPCCPPDPLLVSMLSQIQQMVTLIQRQASPFAYVYGANHAALSGHGSFAVSGLLGVSVAPTTIPTSYGLEVGSPDEHFGLGFITLGTADGWTTSRPLDHDGTLMIPAAAGVFTSVGYSLSAGVVADIRELVREP